MCNQSFSCHLLIHQTSFFCLTFPSSARTGGINATACELWSQTDLCPLLTVLFPSYQREKIGGGCKPLQVCQKARKGCASFACSFVLGGIHKKEGVSKGFTWSIKEIKKCGVEKSKSSQICPQIPISQTE